MTRAARFPIKAETLARLINDELRQYEACRGHELLMVERSAAPGPDGCNWMPGPLSGVNTESSYGVFIFARIIRDFRLRYNVS
jgi:hypothetical protein